MPQKFFIPKDKNLLDPKRDSIFKTLFTKSGQGTKNALKSLVKAIVGYEPKDVEIINNELAKEVSYAKDIRLDLQCRMEDGSKVNVEIQTCPSSDNLKARSLYYGCRIMSSFRMKGKEFRILPKAYQVMFTDFRLFHENDSYIQSFTMRNDEVELSDILRIIFIQMPLFKEEDKNEENLQNIEKWIIFLKDSTNKEKRDLLNRIINTDEGINEAGEILMTISDDEREWAIQESIYKAEVDRQAELLATHDWGVEEGLETAARGMKAKNIPIETIIEITGLTAEQVAAL